MASSDVVCMVSQMITGVTAVVGGIALWQTRHDCIKSHAVSVNILCLKWAVNSGEVLVCKPACNQTLD